MLLVLEADVNFASENSTFLFEWTPMSLKGIFGTYYSSVWQEQVVELVAWKKKWVGTFQNHTWNELEELIHSQRGLSWS